MNLVMLFLKGLTKILFSIHQNRIQYDTDIAHPSFMT